MFRDQAISTPRFPVWAWAVILYPRVVLAFWAIKIPEICLNSDSFGYLDLAKTLIRQFRFANFNGSLWIPETVRVPGYPLFLAGFTLLGHPMVWAIAWAQLLLSTISVWLMYRWLQTIGSQRSAVLFSVLFGWDLVMLFHTPLILSETLFTFALIVTLPFLWKASRTQSIGMLVTAGIGLGVLALIKPIALYFAFPVSFIWLADKEPKRWLIFLAAAYLLPSFWVMRNGLETGNYSFSTQGGGDLLKYPAASVEALRTHRDWGTVVPELQQQAATPHAQGHLAIRIILAHPLYLVAHCALGTVKILGGNCFVIPMEWVGLEKKVNAFGSVPRWQENLAMLHGHPVALVAAILYAVFLLSLYILFGTGLWTLAHQGRLREAYLLVIGPLYFVGLASLEGYCRYRIPAMPFFIAGAALAATHFRKASA